MPHGGKKVGEENFYVLSRGDLTSKVEVDRAVGDHLKNDEVLWRLGLGCYFVNITSEKVEWLEAEGLNVTPFVPS